MHLGLIKWVKLIYEKKEMIMWEMSTTGKLCRYCYSNISKEGLSCLDGKLVDDQRIFSRN